MAPRKILSKAIDRNAYRVYVSKAQDFYQAMRRSLDEGNWNAAGLEAIHCAISATDALLAYAGGIRCTSPYHGDAADLLQQTLQVPETAKNAAHLLRVVEMKNIAEYEARNLTAKEAEDMAKHVERYFGWAKSFLPV